MARKRVNKNLIVALTLFSLTMLVILAALMLRQVKQRDPTYFVQLSKQAELQGDLDSAIIFCGKAWERSNDATYLVELGRLFLLSGNLQQAIASFQTALINEPDLVDAHNRLLDLRLKLARLYNRMDGWKAVRDAAVAFLEAQEEMAPLDEARIRNANGMALVRLASLDDQNASAGEADLIRATELAPDSVDYSLDLARYFADTDRWQEAEPLFERAIADHPDAGLAATKAHIALAKALASQDQHDRAGAHFEQGLALAGDVPEALATARHAFALFLARRWAADRDNTEALTRAERLLTESIGDAPESYEPYLQLVTLYGAQRNHEDVVATCDRRLALGLDRAGIRGARNRLDSFNLMIFASEACISEATASHEAGDEPTRQSWLSRGEQYVDSARSELPTNPRSFVQSARLKLARGLDRQALEDLRVAQDAYRAASAINWDNTIMLARLHLRLKEPGAAMKVMDEVLEAARRDRSGDVRFWMLHAQVLHQAKQSDRAMAAVERILQVDPNNTAARSLQVIIFQEQGRQEEAVRIAEGITDDPVTLKLIEANGLILEEKYEDAVLVVQRGLDIAPADERLVRSAARLLMDLGRAPEAKELVENALAIRPDDAKLQMLLVFTRNDLSDAERDEAVLKLIEDEDDAYQRTLERIGFYLRKNDHEELLPLLDEAIGYVTAANTPSAQRAADAQLRILLETKITVANALGETEAMFAARDLAAEKNVDGAGGKAVEGLVFMHLEDYESAIASLREASTAQPSDGRLLARLGQCYQILGREDEAHAFYAQALKANSEEAIAHKGLAMLAKMRGDLATYERHFKRAEKRLASDPWIQSQRLERDEKADPRAAIARREKERLADPQDVRNLVRLAALYQSVGESQQASDSYAAAMTAEPQSRELVAAAAKFHRDNGRDAAAHDVIARFIDSLTIPEEKAQGHLLMASHFLKLRALDRAESALLDALNVSESLGVVQTLAEFYLRAAAQPDKALPWFDKAIVMAQATHAPSLPRLLAQRVTCLLQPMIADLEKAGRYCDELLADHPDYAPGLLLLSEIRSKQGDARAAIGALGRYLVRFPDNANALYHRALHYLARGDRGSAIQDLEHLKRTGPLALKLAPRLLLARLNLNAGRVDQATRELETLVADAPNSDVALAALIQAYIDQEKFDEAGSRATSRINSSRTAPQAQWFFLRARAAVALQDFRSALADVKRAAELNNGDSVSAQRVLDVCLRAGWADEGITYFNNRATRTGEAPALQSHYARLLLAAGRESEAVEQFRGAMASALGQSADAVGAVSADLNAAFQSLSAARSAMALFEDAPPTGAMGRVNDRIRVRLYRIVGQMDAAAAILNDLIDSTKDNRRRALLYHELGDLHQRAEQPGEARVAYEEALKYDPEYWITLNNLAYVLSENLSEPQLAVEYGRRAVASRDIPDTHDTLGWIYVALGDFPNAIAELSGAVRLGSGDPWHYYHLGEAYRRAKQHSEAAAILQTGRQMGRQRNMRNLITILEKSIQRNAASDSAP